MTALSDTIPVASEDSLLAARVASGDEAAFDELYQRQSARIYSLARRLCGDAVLAEDLTQEVFLHLLRKIGLYHGQAALSTWLYRVAMNFCISYLRAYRKPPSDNGEMERLGTGDAPVVSLHRWLDLEAAIARLPAGYRDVLVLHDVEGLRHDEIGDSLGISAGTSKSQLHHARLKLRRILKGESS
jgi:RNA polymerase sigma-70 factor (ECF subfamily)